MADVWATFQDVVDDYEGTIGEDRKLWIIRLIGKAERSLASRVPSIQRRLDAGTLASDNVRDAVVNMVLRVVRNPEGLQAETEGNYLYSVQRDVAGGKMYPTGDDLALVRPVATGLYGAPIPSPVPCYRSRP